MRDEGRRGRELGDYKELIREIEKIDGLVMKASRNYGSESEEKQKKEGEAIKNEYEKTVKLFDKFLQDLQENWAQGIQKEIARQQLQHCWVSADDDLALLSIVYAATPPDTTHSSSGIINEDWHMPNLPLGLCP